MVDKSQEVATRNDVRKKMRITGLVNACNMAVMALRFLLMILELGLIRFEHEDIGYRNCICRLQLLMGFVLPSSLSVISSDF